MPPQADQTDTASPLPRRAPPRRSAAIVAAMTIALMTLVACSGVDGGGLELLHRGDGLDHPTAVAVRPDGSGELWVTNQGDDSLTVLRREDGRIVAETRRDAYGEHFSANPSGIAFTDGGDRFSLSNDSTNENNNIDFQLNPERNLYFKNNNFMGPTLFSADSFARAGQSKAYSADWPQPGIGHAPPSRIPQANCPPQYWTPEIRSCVWPREGSHLDMLHESPRATGIAHVGDTRFVVLDGCGVRDNQGNCHGAGHLVFYDFNKDHQEGNGFHGDGIVRRYIDTTFTRVAGITSGIVIHDGQIYYADSGTGSVRRVAFDGKVEVMVSTWHPESRTPHGEAGNGIIDWGQTDAPDGDDPANVEAWVAEHGNAANIAAAGALWIEPREVLSEYAYVRSTDNPVVAGPDVVAVPSGMAATRGGLLVADHTDGRVLLLDWSDFRVRRVYYTGLDGLSGLTIDRRGDLVMTDTATDAVYRMPLG